MNRNRRRELKRSKWLNRVKVIYQAYNGFWFYQEDGKLKKCSSSVDFIEKVKFANLLKNTGTPFGYDGFDKVDRRRKNRRIRKLAKIQIFEGIQEWIERTDNMEE